MNRRRRYAAKAMRRIDKLWKGIGQNYPNQPDSTALIREDRDNARALSLMPASVAKRLVLEPDSDKAKVLLQIGSEAPWKYLLLPYFPRKVANMLGSGRGGAFSRLRS